jgi:hypothetical protein
LQQSAGRRCFCEKAKGGGDQPRSRTIGAILSVDSGGAMV